MPEVGDRVEVLPSKAGQVSRKGVVTGLGGSLVTVRWDSGEETRFVPGPGVMRVMESGQGRPTAARRRAPSAKTTRARAPATSTAPSRSSQRRATSPPTRATTKQATAAKSSATKKPAATPKSELAGTPALKAGKPGKKKKAKKGKK
jgi:hypothetical protein